MEAFLLNLWAGLSSFAVSYGFRILGALILLLVGPVLIKWVVKLIKGGKRFSALESNTQTLIVDIVKVVLYVFLVSMIAITLGAEGSAIAEIESRMRIMDNVIRYLCVKQDEA